MPHKQFNCRALGVSITPCTQTDVIGWLSDAILHDKPTVALGHNLHSAFLFHTNATFRSLYDRADLVLADGAPVLWDYRLSGGRAPCRRIGSTDWLPLLGLVENLDTVLVIGANSISNHRFVVMLEGILPNAKISGFPGESWDSKSAERAIQLALSLRPQLTLVGLGMPLQEEFIQRYIEAGAIGAVAAIGGAIDQLADTQPNAPRWLGSIGLEWFWRLCSQPRRLAHRYLVEPWKLAYIRALQTIGRRHHD